MAANAAAACDLLKTAFPGRVTTPDATSEFKAALEGAWSQTCWEPAAGYVSLNSAEDVVKALAIVKKTGSKFAVRASGHNPNPGFSSAGETAVVLDIRQLRSKALGADGIARVGAGSTWGEVYAWLEEQGRSAIGGRDAQVSLGGFVLGGGMGAFSNLHGFGSDGVKNFEVVLADGTIIDANSETNPDLYRSLKGGGSNFGIVTRVDLITHPLIKTQYTINLYSQEDYVNVINATVQMQEAMEKDRKIGLFTNFNHGFIAVGHLYADWPAEQLDVFKSFDNLTSLISTAVPTSKGTIGSLAKAMAHGLESKKRSIRSATTKVSQDLYIDVYKAWLEASKGVPASAHFHFTIQPVGTAAVQAGEDRGGNILGLEKVPQCWWVFTCEWPNGTASDDAAAEKAVDFMAERVQTLAGERGLLLDYKCMTFAAASQKVLRGYGTSNVQRLQETAARYDPAGVFQELQNGGFLLRNNL